ncbi:unnamed protein product [Amaranthus hypochondriacus]
MKLFDDVENDDIEDLSKIEVSKEFAKRFEHNKKREDLQRLEEMKKKGLVNASGSDSDSETDSDSDLDDDVKNRKKEVKFFEALLKVRNKDPILQEKDAKLFESSSDEDDEQEEDERKERKKKPKYLKDVIAQQLIEKGPEFEGEEDDEEKKVKSYAEEQEDLRREVLDAMAEAERETEVDEDEFMKAKDRDEEDEGKGEDDEKVKKMLDKVFGEDEKLDENDMFLKDFFQNTMWIDKEKRKNKLIDDDDIAELSDDEDAIEKQEDYERDYNFRFEENASDRVLGHSRVVVGSVRKETNARKQQRERKKEREALAELERQEEVKRLKNLKRKEIQEKLNKIKAVAGIDEDRIPLNEDDLEEDFDPEKFDKKMSAAFGESYYKADDVDPEFGSDSESDTEKPDFEKEDELLGLPKDWDVTKSSDGFLAEWEKIKKGNMENGDDEVVDEGKKKRKRKKSAIKEVLDKELEEELYKLDYEDTIGDLKTRFKYREVKPAKYGLSAADILMFDEKELNQYVSLKKLAPYREKEWKVPPSMKQWLFQGALSGKTNRKKGKRKDGEGVGATSSGKESMEVVKAQEGQRVHESKLSRPARRRRRIKEKKLPESRLIAYGKMPASSKKSKS